MMNTYELASREAVLIDRSSRGWIAVTGADRLSFLQGLLTNDVAGLAPGHGCYAAWLTAQGRMITDLGVLVFDDTILLDVGAEEAVGIAEGLERLLFAEDVKLQDVTTELASVAVLGPRALAALTNAAAGVMGDPPPLPAADVWRAHQHVAWSGEASGMTSAGRPPFIVRHQRPWPRGFALHGAPELVSRVRDTLVADGVPALEPSVEEALRIEAGVPRFGVDMDDGTIPLEAGLEPYAISFSKGCYVGQEVIVRMTSRGQGQAARKLVGLVGEGPTVPAPGSALYGDGRDVGHVTSAVQSPGGDRVLLLGYLKRQLAEPGTVVRVGEPSGRPATVHALPFGASSSDAG